MVTKTTPLRDQTHKRLTDVQTILRDRRSVNMSLQDIIEYLVPNVEEGFKKIIEKIAKTDEN